MHLLRLVHDVADLQVRRQHGLRFAHQRLDLLNGVDDVRAAALGNLQHHGRLAIDACITRGVFEGAVNGGDIAKGHHTAVHHLDRHGQHVVEVFDHAGYFHAHTARAGVQAAGGDQAVVAADQIEQLGVVDAVTVEHLRVDDDLQQVFAVAADFHREHFGNAFDVLFQAAGDVDQFGFGNRPGEANRQHREQRHVDFVDGRFFGFLGQFTARGVDFFTHIGQGGFGVKTGIKLKGHRGMAFAGHGAHFLDPFKAAQLLLQRPHQQALGVFRADAFQAYRYVNDRDADIRVGFLGDGEIRA